MTIVNAFLPGPRSAAALMTRAAPTRRRPGLQRRVEALVRLLARRRRGGPQQPDHAALREFGLTERHAVASGTSAAAMRRRIELDHLLSASSRFVVRGIDTAL